MDSIREPMTGFEPVTPSLPRKYSTTELHRRRNQKLIAILHSDNNEIQYSYKQIYTMSGRRDSNPRPIAWKAIALPAELLPHEIWWGEKDSNFRSHKTADLQSAPFGRSGITPFAYLQFPKISDTLSVFGDAKVAFIFNLTNVYLKIFNFF